MQKNKKMVPYQLYMAKKCKNPDYLLKVLQKTKQCTKLMNYQRVTHFSDENKNPIKNYLIQKRMQKITKQSISPLAQIKLSEISNYIKQKRNKQISTPQQYKANQWVPPLQNNSKFHVVFGNMNKIKSETIPQYREQLKKANDVLKILDINRHLKNFGQYLETQFENFNKNQNTTICSLSKKQSKVIFLSKKYHLLQKSLQSKFCVANSAPISVEQPHQRVSQQSSQSLIKKLQNSQFENSILFKDQIFKKIMKITDHQLMLLLIKALSINDHFTLTSYLTFYQIFVWEESPKKNLSNFVVNLLMRDKQFASIQQICQNIKYLCSKIKLKLLNFSQNLQGFEEIVKKLIFSDDLQQQQLQSYLISKKQLGQALQKNQECISIFINVFYDD